MTDTNMNSNGINDGAEKMRSAFEEFMLAGKINSTAEENKSAIAVSNKSKKKKKKKKKSSLGGAATPPGKFPMPTGKASCDTTASPAAAQSSQSSTATSQFAKEKSDKKRHYQLLRSFNDKMQHTWFDLDDQLLSILQNVLNIRGRLPLEWKLLHSSTLAQANVPEKEQDHQLDEWKYHGFLGKPKELPYSFHLHTADVELALSHDLTQHEKMLAGMRSLMSDLAECHEALGRVLDTLWKFHLACTTQWEDEEGGERVDDGIQNNMDVVTDVFQMLSMELYRKQSLVPLILESTNDEILGIEVSNGKEMIGSGNNNDDRGQASLLAVQMCCKSWPRSSEESCIGEDQILYVMKLGEISS